ncbi:MAG: FMN-binding negative transcriptional regulator [Pseudomonadota bacterium]
MFQPAVFRETRSEVMRDHMRDQPFATIVSSATGGLTADHVPLVLKSEGDLGVLHGHIASANPLFRKTEGSIEVLVIFQGPQTYVSPSWYASKKEHGKVVPTWNYVVVHAGGKLNFTRDTDWLLDHLDDLTTQHESNRDAPWKVSDAPEEFIAGQLKALVGFEIEITDLSGTWKVSQNKSAADQTGVSMGLENSANLNELSISRLVRERGRRAR